MVRTIRVTLIWKGPYQDIADVTGRAGIYLVIAGQQQSNGKWDASTYTLLDIGQSGEIAGRLAPHEREDSWKQNRPANRTLLFKFATMPRIDYTVTDRRSVECCLRAHHRPLPCGTECNHGYNGEDSVSVTNAGQYAPLRESYSCK